MSKRNRTRPKKAEIQKPARTLPGNWILGLILGVTFLGFSNSILNGFAYDDTTQILRNEFIRDLRNLPRALVTETWYWRVQQDRDPNKQDKPSTPYYRPVFVIYLMILWALSGTWAAGWHLLSVIIHVAVVYFVFRVLEGVTQDRRVTTIATLIFALHPLRSESVAWISGVTDPLLALFLISSFYFYLRHREEGSVKLLIGSLALFLVAAFTKEPAVALPIFIAAYELVIVDRHQSFRERVRASVIYSAPFLAVSAFYFVARSFALGFALNDPSFKSYPGYQVALTIPLVIWKYIGLMLWPFDLSLFHATYLVKSPLDIRFIVPLVGLIALGFALWPLRRSGAARFGVLWFSINLLPVLNFSAFIEDFLVQERYVYISSIGFSLLTAMALARIPIERWLPLRERRNAQAAVIGALVFLLGGRSLAQNAVWKDDMTVWYHGAETAPEQAMSHYVLGHKLINLKDYTKAAEQLEEYLKINPDNVVVLNNLASTNLLIYQYQAEGNPTSADRALLDRALELTQKGLSIKADEPSLWDTLGSVHTFDTGLKNYERAVACFQRGLTFSPGNPMITFHLGGTLLKKGDLEGGISLLKSAVERQPELVDAHKFLGYAYSNRGRLKEAIDELSTYLQLQPSALDGPKIVKDIQDLRARLQPTAPQS